MATGEKAAGRVLALVAIVLTATSLRTAVSGLSPIFDLIAVDVPLDSLRIGLLGTLPPLCFVAFGLLTPLLERRVRLEALLLLSVLAMTAGHLLRAASTDFLGLASASALAFAGTGVANVLLPPAIKKYFPTRMGLLTSVYGAVMALFGLIPPLVAFPLGTATGWRFAVGVWAALAFTAAIPWVVLWLRERRAHRAIDADLAEEGGLVLRGSAWRSPVGWAVAALFGVSALNIYSMFAWLPEIVTSLGGVSPGEAGALLAWFLGLGLPSAIIVPVVAARLTTLTPLILASVGCYVVGYLGLLLAPAAAIWLWVGLMGCGPMSGTLGLILVNLRTRSHEGAVALSGFAQAIGYTLGAIGPLVVGVLHDLTSSWTPPLVFLLCSVLTIVLAVRPLASRRMLEDEWGK